MATTKPRTTKGRAVLCARLAQDKKATNLLILDLTSLDSAPAEFFVIVSVGSNAQLGAVSSAIEGDVKKLGFGSPRREGKGTSAWIILDYFDIVVHIMVESAREFYKLERLWGDAKAYTLTESGTPKATIISTKKST